MTQELSSLMDGELEPHASEQAIRDCGSPQGKQTWECYHMIGEVLREGRSTPFDVSARVMGALEKETVVAVDFGGAKAGPKAGRFQAFGRIALAAAASVATIGVVGWIGTQGVPGSSPAPAVASSGGVTMQANVAVDTVKNQQPVAIEPTYAALEVNEYLAAHRQMPTPDQYRAVAARTAVPAK